MILAPEVDEVMALAPVQIAVQPVARHLLAGLEGDAGREHALVGHRPGQVETGAQLALESVAQREVIAPVLTEEEVGGEGQAAVEDVKCQARSDVALETPPDVVRAVQVQDAQGERYPGMGLRGHREAVGECIVGARHVVHVVRDIAPHDPAAALSSHANGVVILAVVGRVGQAMIHVAVGEEKAAHLPEDIAAGEPIAHHLGSEEHAVVRDEGRGRRERETGGGAGGRGEEVAARNWKWLAVVRPELGVGAPGGAGSEDEDRGREGEPPRGGESPRGAAKGEGKAKHQLSPGWPGRTAIGFPGHEAGVWREETVRRKGFESLRVRLECWRPLEARMPAAARPHSDRGEVRPMSMRLSLRSISTIALAVAASGLALAPGPVLARRVLVTAAGPRSLGDSLAAAWPGDTLLVGPGRYVGVLRVPDRVALIAIGGRDSTILDGAGDGPVVLFTQVSAATLLEGFTITGGVLAAAEGDGAGIRCERGASPRLNLNRVIGNRALGADARGGGIACLDGSNPVISNSLIAENEAAFGGGIYVGKRSGWGSSPVIGANLIDRNRARRQGGGIAVTHGSEPVILMNVIARNAAGAGGGGLSVDRGQPRIEENVVWANSDSAGVAGGLLLANYAAPRVERNIIAENSGPGVSCEAQAQEWQDFRCNDVWGHAGGDFAPGCAVYPGNLSVDPRFCAAADGRFGLRPDSPCLAAPGCGRIGAYGLGCSVGDATPGRIPGAPR